MRFDIINKERKGYKMIYPTTAVREAFIDESERLFRQYYEKTSGFRARCKENENFWRSDHWHSKEKLPNEPYPSIPVLFSSIENVHSELMDNYPEAVLLPYGKEDEELAGTLSSIVNSALERCSFAGKYRSETLRLLKNGACCFSVFWNSSLYGGYGDIDVSPCDMRYFLWDTAYDDIQNGRNVFRFSFHDKEWFRERYPEKADKFSDKPWLQSSGMISDSENGILLIERWYKKYNPSSMSTVVHMAKIAGGVLLEWSEENEETAQTGIYSDGLYPFVVIPLYELEDSPIGMGMIDVFKPEQEYIDMLDRIILKNSFMSGKMRLLKDSRCNIPKEKLADWDEDVLEGSDISDRSIRWFQPASISPMVQEHLSFMIDMLKKDSGQTELARGEATSSITAASAILALQNAASKRTRNIVGRIYDHYTEIVKMMLSRVAQFYDNTRVVRITGKGAKQSYYFDPAEFSDHSKYDFDIKVHAQKKNPYEVTYNNEIAMELHKEGVITSKQMLSLMSFEGKDELDAVSDTQE